MPIRPVGGGTPVRNARFPELEGTLGCVVRARDGGERHILSASHVFNPGGYGLRGDAIEALVGGIWTKVAELHDWTPLRDQSGTIHHCDAAIARITAPELVTNAIEGIGVPGGIARWVFEGKRLRARGAASRSVKEAAVYKRGEDAPVYYEDWSDAGVFALPFDDLILYGPALTVCRPCLIPGDSGTLVVDDNGLAVGLHIARTADAHPIAASVCTPIETVLGAFDVELDTDGTAAPAALPGAAPTAPTAPVPSDDPDAISQRSRELFGLSVMRLLAPHSEFGGVRWQLSPDGVLVEGRLERTAGRLVTVPRVWSEFGAGIADAAREFRVPAELIVATICTESSGDRNVPSRVESGGRMSVGIMQTLIGTARDMLGAGIDEQALRDPGTSIRAGTAYIASQRRFTDFDPPKVACAYNAGHVEFNDGPANRWRMKQYPIGGSAHADRFVQWFNDCFAFFGSQPDAAPRESFWRLFRS